MVALSLAGWFNMVRVPAIWKARAAGSWFCHIHHVRSICPWCSQKSGSLGLL